jgi:hypothetical protein
MSLDSIVTKVVLTTIEFKKKLQTMASRMFEYGLGKCLSNKQEVLNSIPSTKRQKKSVVGDKFIDFCSNTNLRHPSNLFVSFFL